MKGLAQWAKKDIRNRGEYYKFLASLLKSDSEANQVSNKPMVNVNFIGMPAPDTTASKLAINITPVSIQEPEQTPLNNM